MQTTAAIHEVFGEPIYTYTRAQTIKDGALIDVSPTARDAGITWHVAMTAAAWGDCVEWTDTTEARKGYSGQSESGRLWDVCWMLSRVVLRAARQGLQASPEHPMYIELLRVPREGKGVKPRLVHLKFIVGQGNNGRPCITMMLPSED